jgi:hypothetical protein
MVYFASRLYHPRSPLSTPRRSSSPQTREPTLPHARLRWIGHPYVLRTSGWWGPLDCAKGISANCWVADLFGWIGAAAGQFCYVLFLMGPVWVEDVSGDRAKVAWDVCLMRIVPV